MKPIEKILSLLSVISLTLIPISCDEMDIYTGPWQEVPTPGGWGNLFSCYFISPNDGWACGVYEGGDDPDKLILMHWDGSVWTEYAYPGWFDDEVFIAISLGDIAFSSANDGWCVGALFYKWTGEDRSSGFILRYDGNQWYVFADHLGEGVGSVFAISDDDVWFSCWEPYDEGNGSDLFHWNGSELEFVNLYPGNLGISDIAFGSANDGLAVGYYKFVYHWDGISWDLITYDYGGEYSCVAYDTPTTAFIGGDYLRRWENGELNWYLDYDYGTYNGIHFSAPDEGWMYGGEPTEEHPEGDGFIWHWDGVAWSRASRPDFMFPWEIFSIDYYDAWAVGIDDTGNCGSWRYIP